MRSTNQNRQLYVVNNGTLITSDTDMNSAAVGSIMITKDKTTNPTQITFKYKGKGGLIRTDLIDLKKVLHATYKLASAQTRALKKAVVTLDSSVNSGKPISGQDYILNIFIHNYIAPGDDNVMVKHGMVHATAADTAETFYKKLLKSLEANFSREVCPLLSFSLQTETVDSNTVVTGVVITEVEQPWRLGIYRQDPVNFSVQATTVTYNGDETPWAAVSNYGQIDVTNSSTVIQNSKEIADLEYFCMGERGDQARNQGWPNVIPTEYMVDPTNANGYDTLDIHYYFAEGGVDNQWSEKTITFVGEGNTTAANRKLKALKEALDSLMTIN